MNSMLIKYAQRSAKKHVEKGNPRGTVPKATLPEQVNLEMSKKSRYHSSQEDLDSQFNLDALNKHEPLQPPSQKKKQVSWNNDSFQKIELQDIHSEPIPKRYELAVTPPQASRESHYDARAAGYNKDVVVGRQISIKKKLKNLGGKSSPTEGDLYAEPSMEELLIQEEEENNIVLDGNLEWHFESANFKEETCLHKISGNLKNGQVCIVVGDRESHKDTFMRLLSGRALDMTTTGSMYINDELIDAGVMRDNTSYLAGSQLLLPELTVKESLHFVLNFIEKYDTPPELREAIIQQVMQDLDISHLANRRIGRANSKKALSMEERVRLNLAQTLLQEKDVIFLDEPLRGLDLIATLEICQTIKKLATSTGKDRRHSRKFFVSMEHPTKEILYTFDVALFLVRGTQFYYGPADKASNFFQRLRQPLPEETSVYDHVLALTKIGDSQSKKEEEKLERLLEEATRVFIEANKPAGVSEAKKWEDRRSKAMSNDSYINTNFSPAYSVPFSQQFVVLFERTQRQFSRDYSRLYWRVLVMLVWAGFMYFVIRNDGQSGDFERGNDLVRSYWLATIGVQVIMIGNLADAQEDCRQTQSDLRSNLYHPAAFVLGHVLFKLFSMVFLVTPYSVAVYYFLGMQASVSESSTLEKYSYLLMVFLLLGSIVESLNTIVGFMYLKANTTKAVYACVSIHVFFGLFSGGLFRWCDTEFFIKVLSYLSPTKYVLEGLLLNNWEEVEYSFTLEDPTGCANQGMEKYAAWRETDPTGTWAAKYYCTDEFPWMDNKVDIAYVLLGYMVFFGLCMLLQLRKVV